ncbi:NAD-dependent malic enzyme [Aliikangiella coralliicola]|uniref:malate dehydrogenase (oxaloacetate-decarboxylating) n=1 Tax=Aliikangiella coralliicola TaxID=2592383 RepID=A0A545UH80_9GAMM|nr:NAD-dependent malic enzyme [Aliikangiella coralliicola]TQV88773.1 NAD-dependent malic enzyme [Aliikangiella coralliicola]
MTNSSSTGQSEKKRPLYIRYAGPVLLETPLLNKGSAFSVEEKRAFNLEGLLPATIETIEEQSQRAYQQYSQFNNDLDKHIYLRNIQDTNETLYFKLINDHLEEMMPIIYTPTVGLACQKFSQIYRRKRGLFISYPDRDRIDDMLQNATKQNVKVIVVTDSERILGLGDQGIGGMGIPIGKLALYSACGGISPAYTLPVVLDVGTNNQELLDDPIYMGWRQKRISGDEYFEFVDQFIQGVRRRWPNALIQFEDFAQANATPLLKKYQDQLCCFNDDIQGTAAVTVGTLLAACHAQGTQLKDHRVVFVGAGSAGCGIAEQIVAHMKEDGISEEQAISQVYLTSSKGLLTDDMPLRDFQQKFAKAKAEVGGWSSNVQNISLLDLVRESKPTILIGVSGVAGLMSEEVIKTMYASCPKPIVLPLSNPTSKVEALPSDVIEWTEGNAIVATGSPFDPVSYQDKSYPIAQCNNSYIFPGVGLGVIASGATRVTEEMFMTSSDALAACSPLVKGTGDTLLPDLCEIREVSRYIAVQVGLKAMEQGVATKVDREVLERAVEQSFWLPEYRDYRRTSF